jgi:sec-independent protein translocase protein TatC
VTAAPDLAADFPDFAAYYPFGLDPFQLEACAALDADEGVLVAAPTGAGKTVVGEYAVHLALRTGRKCFYTTPIKALLTVDQYLGFIAHMLTIFGVSFEFPLVLVMLNLAGVLSAQRLRQWRRAAIFLLTVFAGAATPSTDPFTMLAMAVPLCLLYEGVVIFARIHDKRKERRSLSAEYAQYADDETSPITMDDLDQPPEVSVGGHGEPGGDTRYDDDTT